MRALMWTRRCGGNTNAQFDSEDECSEENLKLGRRKQEDGDYSGDEIRKRKWVRKRER